MLFTSFFLFSYTCFSQVNQQWVARYNGSINGTDMAYDLAVDPTGNVYVTGSSRVSETNTDYTTTKYDASGNQLWVKTYNGTGNAFDVATAIATDANGNVYITGQSEGSGSSYLDYVTIKYDTHGNELWVRRYDGPGVSTDFVAAIAVDIAGNVYITGSSYGITSSTDYATIKYDTDGNIVWVSRYDGPGNGFDGANALVLDAIGNVYVTGYSTGIGTAEDYATVKYNQDGVQQWVTRYNGPANSLEQAFSLGLDPSGNVYVTGQSFEIVSGSAFATIKYNAAGVEQWVSRYHAGTASDFGKALAADDAGNVYVIGKVNNDGSDFGDDFTTIKYNANGVEQWVARYNGPDQDNDQANALALDAGGNVYVTGFSSKVSETGSQSDYTTIKYNSAGAEQWIAQYNGPGNNSDIATAIQVDANDNVYITGFSNGNGTEADYATIKYTQVLQPCGNNNNKVVVCHKGKPTCISPVDLKDHLKHGDQLGPCASPIVAAKTKDNVDAGSLRVVHFPNPVTTITQIQYDLPVDGEVDIRVYDIMGTQVSSIAAVNRKAGNYTINFDASTLRNGVYYYKVILKSKNRLFVQTCKMSIIR